MLKYHNDNHLCFNTDLAYAATPGSALSLSHRPPPPLPRGTVLPNRCINMKPHGGSHNARAGTPPWCRIFTTNRGIMELLETSPRPSSTLEGSIMGRYKARGIYAEIEDPPRIKLSECKADGQPEGKGLKSKVNPRSALSKRT